MQTVHKQMDIATKEKKLVYHQEMKKDPQKYSMDSPETVALPLKQHVVPRGPGEGCTSNR